MMTTASPGRLPFSTNEPIPGYFIKERLGAGGYGEVWKAEAPGGIAKAIKIVYGYLEDERAARELKSLNRIKEVRHPFLLSLDRIEVVDSHLLIVTELATSSLKDRYEECRHSGLDGIPRDELLMHLRDVADALDYICANYSLQHLDVKPENLLLVGGRVKVADFGLVKELHDVQASSMGGLTPIYAPPEVFDGCPNQHSDQYSLAIVYQEMLTGVLPFQGRTTAQLAAQHLHSKPNLTSLPLADQVAIARALAKNANHRFPNCRALIDALCEPRLQAPIREVPLAAGVSSELPEPIYSPKTEVLGGDALQQTLVSSEHPLAEIEDLPPVEVDTAAAKYRPTLFLGVGGLAGKTLQCLRHRLMDRFGDLDAVPAVQMLLFDTDSEALRDVTSGDRRTALDNDRVVSLPLRPTADYRRDSDKHLQWMSRRWLYNIPRSLQTKGFRPLGRLALVDHAERMFDALRAAISAAVDEVGISASRDNSGLAFEELPPRIVIVASISGGTGSGMVIDLGYAVRKVLAEMGLADDGVCGILVHGTDRRQQSREVAVANSYACLSELHHYTRPGMQYPGDRACGLPAFQPGEAAFRDTYLVHLGDELDDADFALATDNLAEYLYRSTVTPAAAFVDTCRRLEREKPEQTSSAPTLRSFAITQLGCSYNDLPTSAAEELAHALVERWRGAEGQQPARLSQANSLIGSQLAAGVTEAEMHEAVAKCIDTLGLKVDALADELHRLTEHELGCDTNSYLHNFFEELLTNVENGRVGDGALSAQRILETIDSLVGNGDTKQGQLVSLEAALTPHIERLAAQRVVALRSWVLDQIDASADRVKGAQNAAEALTELLHGLHKRTDELLRRPRKELAAIEQALLGDKSRDRVQLRHRGFLGKRKLVVDERLRKYFLLKVQETTYCSVFRLLGAIQSELTFMRGQLRDAWRDLNRLSGEFCVAPPLAEASEDDDHRELRLAITEALQENRGQLLTELDEQVRGELRRVIVENQEMKKVLCPLLRNTARALVGRAIKKIDMANLILSDDARAKQPLGALYEELQAASSRFQHCGGGRRLLLLLPESIDAQAWCTRIESELASRPTVLHDLDNDVVLCYEAEQLPFHRVAMALIDHRPDYMQLAARLHTRIDVNWTPL